MSQQQGQSRLNLESPAHFPRQPSDDIPPRRLCASLVGNQRSAKFNKNQISTQSKAIRLIRPGDTPLLLAMFHQ